MTLTVLMTMVWAKTSPSLIGALKQNRQRDVKLIGVDPTEVVPGKYLVDEFRQITASFDDEQQYIHELEAIVSDAGVDVILPCGNEDCLAVANNRERLEETGTAVATSDYETLQQSFDKYQMYEAVTKRVPEIAPDYHLVDNFDSLLKRVEELGYPERPVVMKPRHGRGGRGVFVLDPEFDFDEMLSSKPSGVYSLEMIRSQLQTVDSFPEILLMEYLPGEIYSSYSLCDGGETIVNLGHHRLWGTASNTLKSRLEQPSLITDAVESINDHFGFDYSINYEFKTDSEGVPKIFDLNPRIGASTAVFRSIGVNLPYMNIRLALNEEITVPDEIDGIGDTIMMRYLTELYLDEKTGESFEL